MKDKLSTLLYEAMEEMLSNDPEGEHEDQLQYEYWAGKVQAYSDAIQMITNKEDQS